MLIMSKVWQVYAPILGKGAYNKVKYYYTDFMKVD